ncbi:MAG: FkbM family methyltransferase [Fibromonadales bacterium]|nr:FkbM family methyltransferase [Fibromonadales bacterium]
MEKFCLESIYSRLGDEESRFLFENRLCYSLTSDVQKMVKTINSKNAIYKKLLETERKIYVFGAGTFGHKLVKSCPEISWQAFIDNDKSKIGKPDVIPIISFEDFIKNSKNALVLIANIYHEHEIKQQLINNGISEEFILIERTGLEQYFDLPYFKSQKNEFFVDAGGLNGYTTKCFFEWLGNANGKSIVFEPDLKQCNICKNHLQGYDNVKIVNKGLWHKKETIKFHLDQNVPARNRISSDGEEIIEVISLDEYLKEEKGPVTFLKMDIEGAELNALNGAKRIISEQKPKLAISIYHKPEDIWEIPSLLLDFVPGYKFYIRHYSLCAEETVLYALSV